jgi:hypothetical protein
VVTPDVCGVHVEPPFVVARIEFRPTKVSHTDVL